jgi:hypothetical protein
MYYKYPLSRMTASDNKLASLKSVFSEPLHWGLQQEQKQIQQQKSSSAFSDVCFHHCPVCKFTARVLNA